MNNDILYVLADEKKVGDTVCNLAKQITEDFKGKRLLLVGVLKGSVVFMSELMKRIELPLEIDFVRVSSYGKGARTSGNINIILDINHPEISNCDVLVIEDIIDSGRTLSYLIKHILAKGAKSVKTCTLLDKPARREVDFTPDYVGMTVPDEFVVGYGLDFAEKYRALPYIGVLKPEIYSK